VRRIAGPLRQMIAHGAPAEEIHAGAIAGGMTDLKAYPARLLAAGLTSVEEVTSVVSIQDA
jgi:type II secretory ATPase GspE/PulE/Tfp pilus assembly ATPase PilB-like protein